MFSFNICITGEYAFVAMIEIAEVQFRRRGSNSREVAIAIMELREYLSTIAQEVKYMEDISEWR